MGEMAHATAPISQVSKLLRMPNPYRYPPTPYEHFELMSTVESNVHARLAGGTIDLDHKIDAFSQFAGHGILHLEQLSGFISLTDRLAALKVMRFVFYNCLC